MVKSGRHLGDMGQQFCFRQTYYRVDAPFRVCGVTRVHCHVGAARLAGMAEPIAFRLLQPVALSVDRYPSHGRPRYHEWLAC